MTSQLRSKVTTSRTPSKAAISQMTIKAAPQSQSLLRPKKLPVSPKLSEKNQSNKLTISPMVQPSHSQALLRSSRNQIMPVPLPAFNMQVSPLAINHTLPISACQANFSPIQSRANFTHSQINVAPIVQSQSSLEKNLQDSNQSLLDLCDMFKLGWISRGENVLSYNWKVSTVCFVQLLTFQ